MSDRKSHSNTYQGQSFSAGAGLRSLHYPQLLSNPSSQIKWFEIISENFLASKGRPRWVLEKIRQNYPIAFHGVSLAIGSPEPINKNYLNLLKALIHDIEPFLVSDHFCWTGVQGMNTHNLLPLPLNRNTIESLVPKIHYLQEFLQRPFVFENASAYMQSKEDDIPEWEFITEICERTGCGILLDINNVYVTSKNFHLDPFQVLSQVPSKHVRQIHLAGHTDLGTYLFDTHSTAIPSPVWELYDQWLLQNRALNSGVPTMIEWDEDIPPLETLEDEVKKIEEHYNSLATQTDIQEINPR